MNVCRRINGANGMSKDNEKKKSDILDDLFQGDDQENDPKLEELLELVANLGEAFAGSQNNAGLKQKSGKRKKTKKRSSSYLSPENFQTLNQAKSECRKLLLKDKKANVSKSRITEIALEIILKDFEMNKEKSLLAQKLQENIENKN